MKVTLELEDWDMIIKILQLIHDSGFEVLPDGKVAALGGKP
jgi:hypothetical protein